MEIINLNLIPGKAWPVAHATQFDKGREFRANLFEGSQVYTLAGDETVDAIIKKPDGNQVTETLVNTADNYVIVTTTEQMTAVAGPSLGEIRITKDDTVIGSLKFILECEQSADTGIESHSEIHNVEAQVAAIVADQYAAEDVVFDNTPTAGHGVGFAVTSEGVKIYVDGKAYALDDLTDVEISAPSNNDVLQYDANAGEWINAPVTPVVDAENVSYDNTASGMTADDVQEAIDELDTDIGDLSTLTTSVKSSLVGAVNEVVSNYNAKEVTYTGNTTSQGFLVSDIDFTAKIRMGYVTDSSTGKYFCILRPSSSYKVVAMVINDNLLPEVNKTNYTLHIFYSDK